jgi:transposase
MRDNDGRRLDHHTLEVLRGRAVEQVEAGAHPEDVAVTLGFHRKTVYGWLAKYRDGGPDALRAKPVPGRPAKLSGPQVARLYALIVGRDPRQLLFEFALWTREMVRQVIRREFDVGLSAVSVGRLLRTMGLSPPRPLHRAYEQSPQAVARWKTEEYPAIRATALNEGATIYFAGIAWAPVGKSITMLSAVTAQGAVRFTVHEGTVNAEVFIDFGERLLHDAPGPVYLIVDGHPAHRAKATTKFVATTNGKLRLFFLPGYSSAHSSPTPPGRPELRDTGYLLGFSPR